MFTWVALVGFLKKLWSNPVTRNIILVCAAGLAIFFFFQHWIRNHDDQKRAESRQELLRSVQKEKEKEWKVVEDQLAAQRKQLDKDSAEKLRDLESSQKLLDAKILANEQQRKAQDLAWAEIKQWSVTARGKINETVNSVPSSDLPATIRKQSAKLPNPFIQ